APGTPWGSVFFRANPSAMAARTCAVTTMARAKPMLVTKPTHRATGSVGGGRSSGSDTGSLGSDGGGGVGAPNDVGAGGGGGGGAGGGGGGGGALGGGGGGGVGVD